MKNQWFTTFLGHVRVRLQGVGSERFVNDCVRRGIYVWNIKKTGSEALTFSMLLKDVKRLRPIYRKHDCDLKFVGRRGLPFLGRRLLKNSGFLIGFVAFFVFLVLLSNMVWKIEIEGAKPETEYLVQKELERMGVSTGKLQFRLPDIETVQRSLTNNVNSITWVGAELRGTTFYFSVVEKNEPEPEKALRPQNLIASKTAVVKKILVEDGKVMVEVQQLVKKGQLLASGQYGREDNPTIIPAKGVVFGETWYESNIEVPLKSTFRVYTGEFFKRHYIKFGDFEIKVWGFEKNKYKRYQEEQEVHYVNFLKWKLPVAYKEVTVREEEEAGRQYTEKQAVEVGKEMAREELRKKLPEKATITGEKVWHKELNNGKLKLSLHYTVIEDIVSTQPIRQSKNQGD
ncbi:sporulation protein YqfD [Ectobacillus ponti]|uniref:Sporulation protein YqfD n=1 Tax=Ectobacillus ponti TaxID=2961894 RepID=A0AA41X1C8_9BACI|nr:sporulation protein YqfD [Ectobacillus ponti]MCP8967169.1 sporulation protein YqfD [Ectobacillus ponti]